MEKADNRITQSSQFTFSKQDDLSEMQILLEHGIGISTALSFS